MFDPKIIFVTTPFDDTYLLGRKSKDYLYAEFSAFDCVSVTKEGVEDAIAECGEKTVVILTLDMPLVRAIDIESALSEMNAKRFKSVCLGQKNSLARICIGGFFDTPYYISCNSYLKLGAKNYNMVYNVLKERILDRHLQNGVLIWDVQNVYVDDTVRIESGVVIQPFCRLEGDTSIHGGAVIASSYLKDCTVYRDAQITYSHLVSSCVGARTTVGPFARLRGADIGAECRIGDFVEVKGSRLDDGVKAAHLTYIGDARVGERTNVGCGTVFCNYDGKFKHHTEVGKDCFIGANVNLVAPINVGDGSFIAAGTTANKDITDGSFVIGRLRAESKIKKQ